MLLLPPWITILLIENLIQISARVIQSQIFKILPRSPFSHSSTLFTDLNIFLTIYCYEAACMPRIQGIYIFYMLRKYVTLKVQNLLKLLTNLMIKCQVLLLLKKTNVKLVDAVFLYSMAIQNN